MSENIKKLIELLMEDAAAADKVFACNTMESAFTVVTSVGKGYTFEEFKEAMELLKKEAHETNDEELTDKELDDVAGGAGYNSINERSLLEKFKRGQLYDDKSIVY